MAARAIAAEPVLPLVTDVEPQPLHAQVTRIAEALEFLGTPLSGKQLEALDEARNDDETARGIRRVQEVLDPLCLVGVNINPESRVKGTIGPAPKELVQQGWTVMLAKVRNEAGVTAALGCTSPNAEPVYKRSSGSPDPELAVKPSDVPDRWLDVSMFEKPPLNKELSGLELEYRIIELYSRDVGRREAKLIFDVGAGSQDLGFRSEVNILFECTPAVDVVLNVRDVDGSPTTGQFVFRDSHGRVYPARARRLAPDFFFHDQIYRHSGESVFLPPGRYEATYTRGPEYRILSRNIIVPEGVSHRESFQLERWIQLTDVGWYSGDHHVHAAGCKHYESPSEGVEPVDMMRHILGEDLNVACVLSWGPCWYYQKQFFDGKVHDLSTDDNLMRYDVEVSGFPSSHAGHLSLIRLSEDDYPNTELIEQWPSWNLPVLQWAKEQGAVAGFSHSGWGLAVDAESLPTFEMPPFDGIGANEYIVDVTHDACDFISAVDTPAIWELNIWYHTLNCGYQCRISGETDFPCIYGERVGLGRSYVKMPEGARQPLDYNVWADGIRDGRCYVSDGLSHLYDFSINGLEVGHSGTGGQASVLAVERGDKLTVRVEAAGLLEPTPNTSIRERGGDKQPYWHIERARVGDSGQVPVELVVNGESVATQLLDADGHVEPITFDYTPAQSSWIAVRIFPSAHTNPIFVEVDGQPIRASKRSAQWCIDAVETCWNQKEPRIRDSEKAAARAAYDHAKAAYETILDEAYDDR
jgi:hypothetical protein